MLTYCRRLICYELTPFAFLSEKRLFTKIMTFFDISKGVSFRVLVRLTNSVDSC